MLKYVIRRAIVLVPTLLVISAIVFAIIKSQHDRPACTVVVFDGPSDCGGVALPPRGRILETR